MKVLLFLSAAVAMMTIVLATGDVNFDNPESLLVACSLGDLECLKESTDLFLKQTHRGKASHDILAIDPLLIPALDVAGARDLVFKNRNVTVTGLQHQQIHDFNMDVATGSVVLTTFAEVSVEGAVSAVFRKLSKSVSGHFTSGARVLGTAAYNYALQTDRSGVEHFVVSPETISCQLLDAPAVVFSPELTIALCKEGAYCPEKTQEEWNNNFRQLVEKAYVAVVHNIRAAAKLFPASAFFTDLRGNSGNATACDL